MRRRDRRRRSRKKAETGRTEEVSLNVGNAVAHHHMHRGGSKNRNPRNPPKFTKSSVFNKPIVQATCLYQS